MDGSRSTARLSGERPSALSAKPSTPRSIKKWAHSSSREAPSSTCSAAAADRAGGRQEGRARASEGARACVGARALGRAGARRVQHRRLLAPSPRASQTPPARARARSLNPTTDDFPTRSMLPSRHPSAHPKPAPRVPHPPAAIRPRTVVPVVVDGVQERRHARLQESHDRQVAVERRGVHEGPARLALQQPEVARAQVGAELVQQRERRHVPLRADPRPGAVGGRRRARMGGRGRGRGHSKGARQAERCGARCGLGGAISHALSLSARVESSPSHRPARTSKHACTVGAGQ